MPVALTPGTRLGAYEVVALVGAGGMGEVYRARDTRLDRTVAIKVLTGSVAGSPQRRERFEREARAISSLNHPHICALYDVGEAPNPGSAVSGGDTVRFLVLEYLEGQTLAERLTSGPLAPAAALRHAIEICGALDKAHRSGIVHRDLKPANVMLTRAGVKLLDFGLAKSTVPVVAAAPTMSMPPTTPANLTVQGTILGTLQYMAPEQIEGLEADARTDIFAFGAVLFEMLTGRTAFVGTTRASLLSAILRDEPPSSSRVRPGAPTALDRIISTCLAKDPDDRYQSARDLERDLRWVASGSSDGLGAGAQTAIPPPSSNRVPWLLAAALAVGLIATVFVELRRAGESAPAAGPTRFTIAPPEHASFGSPRRGGSGTATQLAVSPDGRHIVFVARGTTAYQIWLRPVARLEATPIQGTDGGTFPFWSPDSRSIGFFADGKLKTVQIAGGPPIVLTDAPFGTGGSWSRDHVILFAPGPSQTGLLRVSSTGGSPTVVTTLDKTAGEDVHRWPHFLPDGRHFFYTAVTETCCPASTPSVIRIGSLDRPGADQVLFQAESAVSYGSDHLIFAHEETLMARPFDLDTRQLLGEAFPLAERVTTEGSRYVGASVSENGTLVYGQAGADPPRRLTWFDRTGRELGTLSDAAPYSGLALSPDERRVAVTLETGSPENNDIWLIDIARNITFRLTVDPGQDVSPVWSPDGTRIAFQSSRARQPVAIRQMSSDGTGADELLLEGPGNFTMTPSGWSTDARFIAYTTRGSNVSVLPLFGDRKPFAFAETPFIEGSAVFSPDGRWIAYTSNEGGQTVVYVQSFPGPGAKSQVSRDGGTHPVWRADGRELLYLAADGTMMSVTVGAGRFFNAGRPQALFSSNAWRLTANQVYAVTKDGQRFLVNAMPQQSRGAAPLTVVLNWTAAIHR
jgi:Tol biopolymer transport system component